MGQETIVAVSTPQGRGGIAVIRMSGSDSLSILSKAWRGKAPADFQSHTVHLGWIVDSEGEDIDQVTAIFFKGPRSYTGEDVLEIACHGSPWIQQALLNRLIECGARAAAGGEFTRRAVINGRMDLAQAEGVADMIAASSKAMVRIASTQLKGEFSAHLEKLRKSLLDLGVLLELELDFSEEEVEFADRRQLIALTEEILGVVRKLSSSFKAGNAFKSGVPVAIAGIPNAGKSTLLNALLGEEKAIVSDVPGTTRDLIEDCIEISGILFRFIDTAGLRETDDKVEKIGVDRARKKIEDAEIVLYLIDPTQNVARQLAVLNKIQMAQPVLISTKADISGAVSDEKCISISAKNGEGIDEIRNRLVELATKDFNPQQELVVTNARHYEALLKAEQPLERLLEGLVNGVSADFLAQDLREAHRYLGEITGAITSEEILHTVFARYCIGK